MRFSRSTNCLKSRNKPCLTVFPCFPMRRGRFQGAVLSGVWRSIISRASEHPGIMRKKASILQFRQENRQPENELEDLLKKMDSPENAAPEFLFTTPDRPGPEFFQDGEDEYLIFLEDDYVLIDGGDGVIDFIVANEKTSLAALLANGDAANPATYAKDDSLPLVRDVEVLLSGDIGISRRCELPRLGILARAGSLQLDARWELLSPKSGTGPYSTEIWIWRQKELRLETTLPVRRMPERRETWLVIPCDPDGSNQ
ncbi:hypothetical protein [uncultured Desulfovibrio sp.]|uniref:hypothetical protein n=1 Tax=uncultured Desulfovibrio sp. TaxID=167968 RepID=UPI002804DA74|nr:hypothetical protein [uncultured Desulfovibrio sp.]